MVHIIHSYILDSKGGTIMRKKLMIAFVAWILIVSALYLPRKRFSSFENRYLESFTLPTIENLISLDWMEQFEVALCEQFNLRNTSITIKTYMDQLLGQTDNGRVYFGKEDYLMQIEDTSNTYLDINIASLNKLSENISIPIDFIPVYSSLSTLNDLAPNFTTTQQLDIMAYLKDSLVNIHIVDTYDAFKNQKDYYYKTDHHWTMLGAKKAYELYMNKTVSDELFEVKTDFLGTLYNQAPTLNSTTDTILSLKDDKNITVKYSDGTQTNSYYASDKLNTSDAYRYYLNGNFERIDIETKNPNGKSILIIKDSYANCFIPFLNNDYQFITIVDLRYGNTNLIDILNNKFDRCLILYGIQQFTNDEYFSKGVSYD